jgi:Kdo2-lipid IVA lauroyltransferase/acyltransferase
MKKLQNFLEYFLILLIGGIIGKLPWQWAQACGRGLGHFFYYVFPIRKTVALNNLRQTLTDKTEKEVRHIAHQCYLQFGQTLCEFLQMRYKTITSLRKHYRFESTDELIHARDANKGAICLTGHFGNWELMGAAISDFGIPFAGVAKEQRNPFADRLIAETRLKYNIESFSLGIALRGILKALKEKRFIAIAADQDGHREGVFVQFLGRPSSTPPGPAIFALRTGAPLLFGTDVRETDGSHTITLQNIDHSDLQGVTAENIRILTQRHTAVLEHQVRTRPDHWFWMHKRWKTKPDDDSQ